MDNVLIIQLQKSPEVTKWEMRRGSQNRHGQRRKRVLAKSEDPWFSDRCYHLEPQSSDKEFASNSAEYYNYHDELEERTWATRNSRLKKSRS